MCEFTGCDFQFAVFLSLLLFWCTKQQRTSPQPTSPRSLHLLHDTNNHSMHATTPPSTPALPPSSPFAIQRAPCGHDLRGTDGGAAWQRQQPALGHLPPRSPTQNGCAKISRPKRSRKPSRLKLVPLSTEVRIGRGRGGVSCPDWWVRDVRQPKGGGARSKKGGGPP